MGVTLWTFILKGNGEIARYPRARYDRFWDGTERVGFGLEGAACFIEVAIELQDRRPVSALRFWFVRHFLDDTGRIDEDRKARAESDGVMAASLVVGLAFPPTGEKVTSIEPHLARQRMESEYRWQPTVEQLDRARDAINAAAGRKLVAHDGKQLLPLAVSDDSPPPPPLRLI